MSQQEPEAPSTGETDPVVEVQEATNPLSPEEVRAAQEEYEEEEGDTGV